MLWTRPGPGQLVTRWQDRWGRHLRALARDGLGALLGRRVLEVTTDRAGPQDAADGQKTPNLPTAVLITTGKLRNSPSTGRIQLNGVLWREAHRQVRTSRRKCWPESICSSFKAQGIP